MCMYVCMRVCSMYAIIRNFCSLFWSRRIFFRRQSHMHTMMYICKTYQQCVYRIRIIPSKHEHTMIYAYRSNIFDSSKTRSESIIDGVNEKTSFKIFPLFPTHNYFFNVKLDILFLNIMRYIFLFSSSIYYYSKFF